MRNVILHDALDKNAIFSTLKSDKTLDVALLQWRADL